MGSGQAHRPSLERALAQARTELENIEAAIRQGIITAPRSIWQPPLRPRGFLLQAYIAAYNAARPRPTSLDVLRVSAAFEVRDQGADGAL